MQSQEERLSALEQNLREIQKRNQRVELDKAWETSWIRMIAISILTYAFACLFLYFLGTPNFFNSLIPVIGFILSVQSIPLIKRWWISKKTNNK